MAPLRLHANLLFYGLDGGTWSDPPASAGGNGLVGNGRPLGRSAVEGWHEPATLSSLTGADLAVMASIKAVWDGDAIGVNTSPAAVIEPSTDEGSETKGSESDSLPESSEGPLIPALELQLPADSMLPPVGMLPYMQPPAGGFCGAVGLGGGMLGPPHVAALGDGAALYPPYLPPGGGYMAPHHGFGGGVDAKPPYGYEAAAPTFLATGVVGGAAAAPGPDGVPSIGSYAHLSGQCSRCCFHPKGRCANGYSCQFCHFDHDKRPRNGKKKRYRHQPDDAADENGEDLN